jgi:uncharacterized protein YndB with AHSA1/START domain
MTTTVAPVHTSVEVAATADTAFAAFVDRMDEWWPRAHVLHDSPYVSSHIEPGVGGRWITRHEDGVETVVGRVHEWDPPNRLAFSWMINLQWACEPDEAKASRVTVTFTPVADSRTRVDLVHDRFEAHGPGHESMAQGVGGDEGWPMILQRYAEALAT